MMSVVHEWLENAVLGCIIYGNKNKSVWNKLSYHDIYTSRIYLKEYSGYKQNPSSQFPLNTSEWLRAI